MLYGLLGYWTPGPMEILVVLFVGLIYVGIPVLIISLIIRMFKYFKEAAKERKLLRIEMGKLAEEVQLLRKQKDDVQVESSE